MVLITLVSSVHLSFAVAVSLETQQASKFSCRNDEGPIVSLKIQETTLIAGRKIVGVPRLAQSEQEVIIRIG